MGQESTYHQGNIEGMSVLQKLGVILESKVVQKLSLEKNFLENSGLLDWYS